jgi:hypothetical protein
MNGMPMLQQQQDGLQHLLRQVEQRLQLDDPAQQQQQQQQLRPAQLQHQLMQPDQLLLAQAQQAQQQHQQQMDNFVLAQQQLVMANAASSNQGMGSAAMVGAGGFAAGGLQQRGGAVAGMQPQLVMMQDAAAAGHRGESFTSQCSTSSYVTNVGALRALSGSLPVSPLIDRSAHSFTLTDRSNAGSFTALGAVLERPHSFTVGDNRPQAAALLASLGERPPSFTLGERPSSLTLMEGASRPSSFTLGPAQPCAAPFLVERSAASFSGIVDRSAASFSGMDVSGGLAVVERSSHTQRSFTYGQRPQLQELQQQGMAWYESDPSGRGLLASPVGAGPPGDSNAAVFQQLVAANQAAVQLGEAQQQQQQRQQQQQQAGGRLSALWNWR